MQLGSTTTLCHTIVRGSNPLPDQFSWEHTGPQTSFGAVPLIAIAFYTHSFLIGKGTVGGYVPMVHSCSFMCTNHIDMTAHTPAFLQVGKYFGFVALLTCSGTVPRGN